MNLAKGIDAKTAASFAGIFWIGAERSQAMIGVQMASAYVGICLMPPFFGLLANHISIRILPLYLLLFLVIMGVMYELLNKK